MPRDKQHNRVTNSLERWATMNANNKTETFGSQIAGSACEAETRQLVQRIRSQSHCDFESAAESCGSHSGETCAIAVLK